MSMTHRAVRSAQGHAYRAVLLAAVATLVPAGTEAQGWIEPRPMPGPAPWAVEKVRTSITVRVTGRVAHVEVEEWFRNHGRMQAEGDYVYPLPGEAVFASYSLYQGEQELRGELMRAEDARAIYERIVRARQDPALIELLGKGMLRARVFPIEAGEERRVTLRYTQVLERAGNALQFRYSAGSRHAGDAMPLPRPEPLADAPRASRNARTTPPLSFTLVVEEAARFRDAFSPTHPLRVQRERGRMTVRPRDELSGDFSVFLPYANDAVGMTVATHNPPGEAGYFMLTLSPAAAAESRVPRDVTVVVDVSGSMSGEKMEQARGALHQLLGTLTPADRMRLIAFSSAVRPWRDGWVQASPARIREARRWVDDLRAEGGTNIHDALESALDGSSPESRLPIVVFLTDGMPTNGETRPDRIVAMAEAKRRRARVFAFGVGYDVNTNLLDALSEAARGTTHYVRPNEDVEQAVSTLAARIRHPVLTDLAISNAPVRLRDVYPRVLPDLFAGEDLVLFGRYEGSGAGQLALRGRRNDAVESFTAQVTFPARENANDYMARLWASRRLGDLERQIRSAQADGAGRRQVDALIEELRETALRYGLLSEYTAYLVQEPGLVAGNAVRGSRGLALDAAVAAPAAVSSEVAGKAAVERADRSRRSRAVNSVAEMEAVQLSEIVVTGAAASPASRVIAGRTFVKRDGAWHDVRHDAKRRVLRVEPYSAAYFALVSALPELAQVLKELRSGLVAGERVSIEVVTGGTRTLHDAELRRTVAEFRQR
jgi:Ca-activated chloride channel homolog